MNRPAGASSVAAAVPLLPFGVLLGWVVLAYLPALGGGFCYDDEFAIQRNAPLQRWSTLGEALILPYWNKPVHELLYRPLTSITYGLNWLLGGGRAWTFHSVNVALHLGNLWLLYRFLGRSPRSLVWRPWIVLLWGVHPLLTESVAYISGRADLLAAAFVLLGLLSRSPVGSAAAFALGLLSKENALVLPLLLLVRDCWLTEGERPDFGLSSLLVRYAPLVAVLTAWSVGKVILLGGIYNPDAVNASMNPLAALPLWKRIAAFPMVAGFYGWLAIVPWSLSVAHDGAAFPVARFLFDFRWWAGLMMLAGLAWAVLRRPAIRPWVLLAAAAFLPFSQLLQPIGVAVAERFAYCPLAFLAAAFIPLLPACRTTGLVLLGAAVLLTVRTGWRGFDYRDNRALFGAAVRAVPASPLARHNYAQALLDAGDVDGAVAHLEEARALNPASAPLVLTLAGLQARRGLEDEARKALAEFIRNRSAPREILDAYLAFRPPVAEALDAMEHAAARDPHRPDLGVLEGRYALAAGRADLALPRLERAWIQGLRSPDLALGIAEAALKCGEWTLALPYLQEALGPQPDDDRITQVVFAVLASDRNRAPAVLETLAAAYPGRSGFACPLAELLDAAGDGARAAIWIVPCLASLPAKAEERPHFETLERRLGLGDR
jgi:tetratricopeptide (TPR) repeat protein